MNSTVRLARRPRNHWMNNVKVTENAYSMRSLFSAVTLTVVGWLAQLAERRSLAGELTLFYPRPVAYG